MVWDDLRIVLAIARAGSLSGAARTLRVNQTTVGRRLTALERRLGTALFFRTRMGFHLTEAGESTVARAEIMESEVLLLHEAIGSELQNPSGLVRIVTMPWIFNYVLVPALPVFSKRYPRIELQAIADLRERSLSNREAELALRFEMPPRGQERAFEIASFPYAVYGPQGISANTLPWIGSAVDSGAYAPEKWLNEKAGGGEPVCFRSDDAGIVYQAARAGVGKGLLPEILGENDPNLVRLSGPDPEMVRRLRVLVHPAVERFARITAVIGWLRDTFARACNPVPRVSNGDAGRAAQDEGGKERVG